MALRALMVDVDGVLIRHEPGLRWDSSLLVDLGIDPDVLATEFFNNHFADVVLGRADLAERLDLVLAGVAPHVPAARLMEYWFSHDAPLDTTLLRDLRRVRQQGMELYLATVQEHHRARYLWETVNLKAEFDGMHYAADLGYAKPDARFYKVIERRVRLAPDEILLIDDRQENVDAARESGWAGHLWTPTSTLTDVLKSGSR